MAADAAERTTRRQVATCARAMWCTHVCVMQPLMDISYPTKDRPIFICDLFLFFSCGTMFFFTQVMWQFLERVIERF